MNFRWNGARFDTNNMRSFSPSGGNIQGIYWTPDYNYVFVASVDITSGLEIHRADIPEIDRLARRLGIDELLSVTA